MITINLPLTFRPNRRGTVEHIPNSATDNLSDAFLHWHFISADSASGWRQSSLSLPHAQLDRCKTNQRKKVESMPCRQ